MKNDSDEWATLYQFFVFVAVSFAFDSLIFMCFGVLQFSCKYIFIYLCDNVLQSAMGLIISSPPLSHKVLSLNITLGLLFVFLSYNLVGYRFVFTLYCFLFISRISRNFVFDFIAFNRVEFSFFHGIVEFIFLLFVA